MTRRAVVDVAMTAGRLLVRADEGVAGPRVASIAAKLATDARAIDAAAGAVVEAGDHLLRIVVAEPAGRGRSPQVLVEVHVPRGTDVVADAGQAEVVCTGQVGALEVRTTSGSVHAEDVEGSLDVRTGRGPVTVHRYTGDARLSVSDAGVIIRAAHGPLSVHGRSGDVHVWSLAASAQIATSTGNVRVGWQGESAVRLDVATHTGRVDMRVGNDPNAQNVLAIRTISGDIRVTSA
jgi:hypothetical protein